MSTLHRPANATWKIAVYPGDERGLPHFHVEGPGFRCSVVIETGTVFAGAAPARVLRPARRWAEANQVRLMAAWQGDLDA